MPTPHRSFLARASADGEKKVQIDISELAGCQAENLGLATWGAAVVLADILHRWSNTFHDSIITTSTTKTTKENNITTTTTTTTTTTPIPILELGAGTGLAGLTAAALWKLPAILSDLPTIVPGTAHNIDLNPHIAASAAALDWTEPSRLHLHGQTPASSSSVGDLASTLLASHCKANIIIAADTCYTEDHPELVTTTVATWLARTPYARAIFCYPLRMAYIDHARNLWQAMEASGFICLEEGREAAAEESWGEIDPAPYEWSVWAWKQNT